LPIMSMLRYILHLTLPAGIFAALQTGRYVHCVGSRAHALEYKISGEKSDGDSLDGIDSARIVIRPAPESNAACQLHPTNGRIHNGSRFFCYGVNANATCNAAKASLPIEKGLDCDDCFLGPKPTCSML